MVTDFTTALGGLFVDPYKAHRHASVGGDTASSAAGKATLAAGGSLIKMTSVVVKGALVDTPVAIAEGMKNMPRLYGEEVADHGKVTDWKSGGTVAAKVRCECFQSLTVHGKD